MEASDLYLDPAPPDLEVDLPDWELSSETLSELTGARV